MWIGRILLLRTRLEVHNVVDGREDRQSLGLKRKRGLSGRLGICGMVGAMAFVTRLMWLSMMTFGFSHMTKVFAVSSAFEDGW